MLAYSLEIDTVVLLHAFVEQENDIYLDCTGYTNFNNIYNKYATLELCEDVQIVDIKPSDLLSLAYTEIPVHTQIEHIVKNYRHQLEPMSFDLV